MYLVGCRSTQAGLEVTSFARHGGAYRDPADAARALAGLIEARGGRGARASIAVSGFGAYHQILSLPPAPREVLLPVIGRELRRLFPDLYAVEGEPPLVDYASLGPIRGGENSGQRDLLAAAVPRSLIRTVQGQLEARGISITHWTILPRAMQRLYEAFAGGDPVTAVMILADGSSLLGLFHGGELRLFTEAPYAVGNSTESVERIERGALYVRQQFRGSSLERVMLAAADAEEVEQIAGAVSERLGLELEPFGPGSSTPGALVALGAALDAASGDPLQLLPVEARPPGEQERWTRWLLAASLAIVLAAGGWWAWSGVRAESHAEQRYVDARAALDSLVPAYERAREIVEARRSHAERARLIRVLLESRERLPELLWPIGSSTSRVRVELVRIETRGAGWAATVEGLATAESAALATSAIDGFFQSLRRELPDAQLSLNRMAPLAVESEPGAGPLGIEGPIATGFTMSFIVPGPEETLR
jgi:hypothetical protein